MTSHSPLPVGAIKTRVLILLIVLIVCGVAGTVIFTHLLKAERKPDAATTTPPARPANLPPGVTSAVHTVETAHYVIASNATPEQTALVAQAVESLYTACTAFFSEEIKLGANPPKLKLMLYKDQAQFKVHNTSQPWAEAFYRAPWSHAYYDDDAENPYHWMLHEATHQLRNEVARFPKAKWIDEGLATYFSTSQIRDGKLVPGTIDVDTYPIWHLRGLTLTGSLEDDIRKGRIIPLRDLIAGTGPDIAHNVNLYYIEYWSLSHFLFHYGDGKYAKQYKALIAKNGSLDNFEKLIGPAQRVQGEWYEHLKDQINEVSAPGRLRVRVTTT